MSGQAARMRVLVTRAAGPAETTAGRLRAAGYEPVVLPLIEYRDSGAPLPHGRFDGIIFTSAAAVEILAARPSGTWAPLRALPTFCVGTATARAASAAGFSQVVSGHGSASDLVGTILSALSMRNRSGEGSVRLLWLAPHDRAFDLAAALSAHGIVVTVTAIYRAVTADPGARALETALRDCAGGAVLLYSPRSAEHLVSLAARHALTGPLAGLTLLAISENVARAIAGHGISDMLVSEMPQEDGLFALLDRLDRDGRASPRTDDDEGHH
ncbi:MAG: uroporphyrinogen-III synthase [Pseudomonadota bacterium]|nr:uroporphyrinogen-III synthase [Pseudomonadota bacterium]